ncbi:MAG: HAD family phosphatase [Bacteroidota bacterium]
MMQAIIFDYGNVIATLDNSLFLRRIAQHSTLPIEEIKRVIYHEPNLSRQYETGQISSDEFYEQVVDLCRVSMSKSDFRQAFTNIFTTIQPSLHLIKKLKPHYKLALLSNTNEWDYQAEIETMDVFPLFDAITASYQVGAMKPDERVYRDVLKQLSVPPEVCVYVDDIKDYVEAAERIGIHGIHYTSHESLLNSLKMVGVEI